MNPTLRTTWTEPDLEYPETDGLPMAENTTQFRWIVKIKEGIQAMFRGRDDVFVAGDLFWYPVKGRPDIRLAPDTLVVFGCPPGDRRSYKQWEEGGIAPHVVFEVLSPGNTTAEMRGKLEFYDRHGVQEYYVYDPDNNALQGWLRDEDALESIPSMDGWTSPRLRLRFLRDQETLRLIRPDGRALETYEEIDERADQAQQLAEQAERRADQAQRLAEQADRRAEQADRRAEQLAAKLRALGIDPDDPAAP
ncbi:MAG: Uma2 family endonuclease [Isosphaeraceae bacterium]